MKFSSYKSVKVQQYLSMNEQTRFPPNPGLLVVAYASLSRMITKKYIGSLNITRLFFKVFRLHTSYHVDNAASKDSNCSCPPFKIFML